jgi:excisionase family DNA binding protein
VASTVYIREFEFVEEEGMVCAYPCGLEGGTCGTDIYDAVDMAADWLRLWVLDELAAGREPERGTVDNEPRFGGRIIAVATPASLADVPAVSSAEAARILGVSRARVKQLCDAKVLMSWKVGATRMISRQSVEARLAAPLPVDWGSAAYDEALQA